MVLAQEKNVIGQSGYPIFYRYVICYSIAQNILGNNQERNYDWISQEMTKLIEAFHKKELYSCPDFLELYPLAEETGFVLVDQTNSCYPLIIYDERFDKEDKKPRVYALGKSLEDVNENLEIIYRKLLDLLYEDWTEDFQKDLSKLFTHTKHRLT